MQLPIRSIISDVGLVGGGFKLDENSCLNYLAEFYKFLINKENTLQRKTEKYSVDCFQCQNNAELASDRFNNKEYGDPRMYCVTRQLWLEFCPIAHSLINENEIEALWSLFSTIIIVEGLSLELTDETNKSDPQSIGIDFRHISLLLYLQTKKGVEIVRNQIYNRLFRAPNNEIVYSNPAAAAAAYQHAAQVTGGLVSPRNSRRSTHKNFTQPSSFLYSSLNAIVSPRSNSSALPTSSALTLMPQNKVDNFKQFIVSNLKTLMQIVHYQFSADVVDVYKSCVDTLNIYIDVPSISSIIENSSEYDSQCKGFPDLLSVSPAIAEKLLVDMLVVDPVRSPTLCPSASLSRLLTSSSVTTRTNTFGSPVADSSPEGRRRRLLEMSNIGPFSHAWEQQPSTTICIEEIRKETILLNQNDNQLIIKHNKKNNNYSSVVFRDKASEIPDHVDSTEIGE